MCAENRVRLKNKLTTLNQKMHFLPKDILYYNTAHNMRRRCGPQWESK